MRVCLPAAIEKICRSSKDATFPTQNLINMATSRIICEIFTYYIILPKKRYIKKTRCREKFSILKKSVDEEKKILGRMKNRKVKVNLPA